MASWFDSIALVLVATLFVGAIFAVMFVVDKVSKAVTDTKESLKNKGLHISDKGVSVKTSSRFNREDYLDATQRGFIKAMGASSFGTADNIEKTPVLSRQASSTSEEKEKKRSHFLRRGEHKS